MVADFWDRGTVETVECCTIHAEPADAYLLVWLTGMLTERNCVAVGRAIFERASRSDVRLACIDMTLLWRRPRLVCKTMLAMSRLTVPPQIAVALIVPPDRVRATSSATRAIPLVEVFSSQLAARLYWA